MKVNGRFYDSVRFLALSNKPCYGRDIWGIDVIGTDGKVIGDFVRKDYNGHP